MQMQPNRYTWGDIWHAARTERHFNQEFWLDIALTLLFKDLYKLFSRLELVIHSFTYSNA